MFNNAGKIVGKVGIDEFLRKHVATGDFDKDESEETREMLRERTSGSGGILGIRFDGLVEKL
jgi:hypothetical protein